MKIFKDVIDEVKNNNKTKKSKSFGKKVIATFLATLSVSSAAIKNTTESQRAENPDNFSITSDYKNTISEELKANLVPDIVKIPFTCETFNIRMKDVEEPSVANEWETRKELLMQLLNKKSSDIIALQEVQTEQINYIMQNLSKKYDCVLYDRNEKEDEQRSATLFNTDKFQLRESGQFWLSETPDVPNSSSWNARAHRICGWAVLDYVGKLTDKNIVNGNNKSIANSDVNFAIVVMNTHVDTASDTVRTYQSSVLSKYAKKLANDYNCTTILLGDFNCGERTNAYKALIQSGFSDAKYLAHTIINNGQSYNGWGESKHEREIDHMFVLDSTTEYGLISSKLNSVDNNKNMYIVKSLDILKYEIDNEYAFQTISEIQSGTKNADSVVYASDHYAITYDIDAYASIDTGKE